MMRSHVANLLVRLAHGGGSFQTSSDCHAGIEPVGAEDR
jgi:hypothetical protein